jgi:hypothetical protein
MEASRRWRANAGTTNRKELGVPNSEAENNRDHMEPLVNSA